MRLCRYLSSVKDEDRLRNATRSQHYDRDISMNEEKKVDWKIRKKPKINRQLILQGRERKEMLFVSACQYLHKRPRSARPYSNIRTNSFARKNLGYVICIWRRCVE